jgi:hypothetical protein
MQLIRAIAEVAAATRKMLFRYSGLCGMASERRRCGKIGNPNGFQILRIQMHQIL